MIISAQEFVRSLDDAFFDAAEEFGLHDNAAKRAVRYEEQLVHRMLLQDGVEEYPKGYRLSSEQLVPVMRDIDGWVQDIVLQFDGMIPYAQVADNLLLAIACTPAPDYIVHWQAKLNTTKEAVAKRLERYLPKIYVKSYDEQDLRTPARLMIAADVPTYVNCMRTAMRNFKKRIPSNFS